jgi:hypothetical protein
MRKFFGDEWLTSSAEILPKKNLQTFPKEILKVYFPTTLQIYAI